MTQAEKQEIIKAYATHEGDTGSPEVLVAVLTTRLSLQQGCREIP